MQLHKCPSENLTRLLSVFLLAGFKVMLSGAEEDWNPNATRWQLKYWINLDSDILPDTGNCSAIAWHHNWWDLMLGASCSLKVSEMILTKHRNPDDTDKRSSSGSSNKTSSSSVLTVSEDGILCLPGPERNDPHTLVQAGSGLVMTPYLWNQDKYVNEQQIALLTRCKETNQPDTQSPHQNPQVSHPPLIWSWPSHQVEPNLKKIPPHQEGKVEGLGDCWALQAVCTITLQEWLEDRWLSNIRFPLVKAVEE